MAMDDRDDSTNLLSTDASNGDGKPVNFFEAAGFKTRIGGFGSGAVEEIGIGEKLRRGMESETGEEYSTGHAVASRMLPFVGRQERINADEKTRALEAIREQYALDDIKSMSPEEYEKYFIERESARDDIVARESRGYGNAYKSALESYRSSGKGADGLYEDAKKEALRDTIVKAGLDRSDVVNSPEFKAMSADEQLAALMPYAEEELKRQTKTKQTARNVLGSTRQGTWGKVVSSGVENTGYTLEFAVGSMLGGFGGFFVPAVAASAERSSRLSTNDYSVDESDNLVNEYNAYTSDEAGLRGVAGGVAEAAVEVGLGAAIGLVGKVGAAGIRRLPGGAATLEALGKVGAKVKGAANKVPGVRALSWLGRQYDKVSAITQQHEWPEELAEEDVQAFIDNVIGLDKKNGEARQGWDEYRRDTLNWNNQRDILVGMLGTMVVQGAYGAARGAQNQRKVDKEAEKRGGFTARNANVARNWLAGHGVKQGDIDGLSDGQAAFLANVGSEIYSMSPEDRERLVEAHGEKVAALADTLAEQRAFQYDQQAVAEGRKVARFNPMTETGSDGKQRIKWLDAEYTDPDTGKKRPARVAMDEQSGVAVRDNGVGPRGERSYSVIDKRGNERIVSSWDEAGTAANLMAKAGAARDAENERKAQVVRDIVSVSYANGAQQRFKIFNTANDAVDALAKAGATDEQLAMARRQFRGGDAGVRIGGKDGEPGTVGIILDNLKSPNHAYEVIRHETIGHNSLANKFGGKEGVLKFLRSLDSKTMREYTAQVVDKFKRRYIAEARAAGTEITPEVERDAEQMALKEVTSDRGIQEVFAHMVQSRAHNPLLRQRILHFMRNLGKSRGATAPIDDNELEILLSEMEQEAAQGTKGESNISVGETMSIGGISFLRADEAAPEAAEESEGAEGGEETGNAGGADQSDENYGRIREGVTRGLTAALGRTPSSTEIDNAVTRIVDAGSWEDAMNAITDLGLQDDTALFDAAKAWHNTTGGTDEAGTGRDEAPAQPVQGAAGKPAEGEAPQSGAAPAAGGEVPGSVKPEPRKGMKFDSEASYHAKIMSQVDATEEPLDSIEVDNELVPNVKKNADPVTGEVNPIQGEPIDLASNPIVVWELKDGRRVVATGRHRYWLYKRAGRKTIPARVIREADGWTQKDILVLDAMSNIIDRKGTVNDYYDFFKRITPTRAEATEARLLDTEIGRSAFSIFADATEDTQGAVNWEEPTEYSEDRIPVEAAATIASILPKDANPYHAGAQRAVIDTILKNPKMRGRRLEILARQLAYESKLKADGGKKNGKGGELVQDDLFGADDSFMKEMAAIAEYRAKKAAGYRYDANVLANASGKKSKDLALKGDKAKEYGITDASDTKQIKKAYDTARAKEKYWAEGNLTPEDEAQMRKDLGLPPKAGTTVEPPKEESAPEPPKDLEGQGDLFGGEDEQAGGGGDIFDAVKPNEAQRKTLDKYTKSDGKVKPIIDISKVDNVKKHAIGVITFIVLRDNEYFDVCNVAEDGRFGERTYSRDGQWVMPNQNLDGRDHYPELIEDGIMTKEYADKLRGDATPKPEPEPKEEPKQEPAPAKKEAAPTPPKPKKEKAKKETSAKPKSAPKPKSSLDLGDAEGALDDALDGLDDAFGATRLSVDFASTDFDPEAFGRQVTAVGKVVNVLASKGFTNFKSLATVIYEKKRDLWPKVKPHLRKVWNAIAEDRDYEEISKKDAEAIFNALENDEATPETEPGPEPAPKEEPKEGKKPPKDDEVLPPPSPEPPPPPPPRKGHFSPEEAGKIAFDLGGTDADKKEVADLIGDIAFASNDFAIGMQSTKLADGTTAAAPVATAPRQLTPAEKEHNRVTIEKLIRKLVSMGHNTFDKLVRVIANASYKLYNAVKNTLRSHWSDAVSNGYVPEENDVTVKQAKEVIAEVDDELADALHIEPEREDGRTQWSLKDQRDAYLALTNKQFAVANPQAVKIANEMLAQGVPVSGIARIQDWWTQDDAAYWPVQGLKIEKVEDAAALFQMLSNPYVEIFKVLYIDKNHRVLEGRVLGIGSRTSVGVAVTDVTRNVPEGTVGVIVSHNHPSGNAIPSGPVSGQLGDIVVTEQWMTQLNDAGLLLLDHIVTDTNRFTSMAVGASKGVEKAYGRMHFNINAAEYWNPKIVGRGMGLYDFPPMPWENVPREEYGLGFYNGKHSKSVATFFAQQLSTHNQDRSMLVFLNDDQKIVSIVRIPTAEAEKKGQKLSDAVFDIIQEHPEAANAMLYVGRERFDVAQVGDAFMRSQGLIKEERRNGVKHDPKKVAMYISAVYSISKGGFIGEKADTAESHKFIFADPEHFTTGYEEGLFGGTLPELWDKDAKNVSKRVPKALPLEVLPKNRYNVKQREGTDYDAESDSGQDSRDGNPGGRSGESGEGSPGHQTGSEGMGGRLHPDGSVGGSDNGGVPGQGQGPGLGAGQQNGSRGPGMGGGRGRDASAYEGLPGNDYGRWGRDYFPEQEAGGARDSVNLPPGSPDTQRASDNFIATEKVLKAWERVDDKSPAALVERAKANMEAIEVLDSLGWTAESDEDATDANILSRRVGAPQRTPTMEEKEAIACFTGWYGFRRFLGNDDYDAAYKQYLHFTEETTAAGIEPDEEGALASAADRTNSLRSISDDSERAVKPELLKLYKQLRESLPEGLQREIRASIHEGAHDLERSGAENAPAMQVGLETTILDAVSNAGLKGGYFINPFAGWGRDAALAGPRFAKDVNWTFFEPNAQKAQILRALYPKANVFNGFYRASSSVNNFYDFAITVVPNDTSTARNYERRAEDMLENATHMQTDVVKLVRQLRPGGVAAIVTPEIGKDGMRTLARMVGLSNGRILGTMLVPAEYAGYSDRAGWTGQRERLGADTQAMVMIVQRTTTRTLNKDAVSDLPSSRRGFARENVVGFVENTVGADTDTPVTSLSGATTKTAFGIEFAVALGRVMRSVDSAQLENPNAAPFATNPFAAAREAAPDGHPERETFTENGVIKIKEDGKIKKVRIGSPSKTTDKKESDFNYAVDYVEGYDPIKAFQVQKDYERLRKAINDALAADYAHSPDAKEVKAALKKAYDEFVARNGFVNSRKNSRLINLDQFNAGRVLGIIQCTENDETHEIDREFFVEFDTPEGRKSFLEVNPFSITAPSTVPNDSSDAVMMSLRDKGFIDPTYIRDLLGERSAREAMQKLLDERVVFIDPSTQRYADRSEYLSGLVRTKYEAAKKAASIDSRFLANAEELQKVIRPMTSFDAGNEADRPQVSARCGFVPIDIMKRFFREVVGIHGLDRIDYNKTAGRYIFLDDWGKVRLDNPSVLRIGTNADKAKHIKWWLNGRPGVVKDAETNQVDDEATEDLNNAFAELDRQLANYIAGNRAYKAAVERAFSEQLQDEYVERDYSEYVVPLPGVSQMWHDRSVPAERAYQRRAIAGVFYGDTQLLDHNVGSGKTFEMISSIMAMKRFGKVRKPMFAATPTTVRQIHYEWMEMYPTAKLLVLETADLSRPENRLNTLALIRDNDWDGIIVSHRAFKEFGLSRGFVESMIEDVSLDYDAELAELKRTYGVADAEERGERRRTSAEKEYDKQKAEVEEAKDAALAQYNEMLDDAKANRTLSFDETGIDYLAVDEAHYFKTVQAQTSKGTIRGVVTKGENSGLTKAMVPVTYYLNKMHGGRHGVLFATGTPLTNSFTEVYTMLNYLAPGLLREIGAPTLDSFLNAFCNFKVEFTPRIGGGFDAETVLSLANAYPLSRLFRQVADVALAGQDYKVKDLPNRRDYIVSIPQSEVQQYSTDAIASLAQRLRDGARIPGVNEGYLKNFLGRTVAINPYLLGIRDNESSRAKAQARIIKSFYDKDPKMHHVIFADLGAPKEFEYPNMVKAGNDAYQIIGKKGRLIDVGPRNPYTGMRKLTITQKYSDALSLNESLSTSWSYLDDVPGQSTGGAPFNPAALHMALARLERKADVIFGGTRSVGARKRGKAVSYGDTKKKAKLSGGEKFDFKAALQRQIAEVGFDPRLTEADGPQTFMIPPLNNKHLRDIYRGGEGEAALDDELMSAPQYLFYGAHTFDEYSQMVNELVAAGIPADEIAIANEKEQVEALRKDFNSPNGKIRVLITGKAAQEGVNFQKVLWTLHHHDIPWMPGDKGQRDGRIWRPGNTNNPVHVFNYITPDSADGRSYTVVTRKQKLLFQIQTRPDHNLQEDVGSDAGSLAEMAALAIKDKRVYWQDRLEKALRRSRATVDGEERRIEVFDKNIRNFTAQRERQQQIVDEYRRDLMPLFEKREAAKREFAIETPKGEKLTTTMEILQYLSDAARGTPDPVRRTAEEFTVGDYLTYLNFTEEDTGNDISNVEDFLATEGISKETGLSEYYNQADLVHRMHVENYLDAESSGEKTVGSFYGAPVKIVSRFSNGSSETGGRKVVYSAEIEAINAAMAMPVHPVMKDGKFEGEAPQGTEQGVQQMKGNATRTLNPVSDNRPVPKAVANAEDVLFDINERLKTATNGRANSQRSLEEAQGPIDSLERRLQMLHDSFMADSNGGAQPKSDFIENLESYMKDGEEDDEESQLYKVDGGAVLRDGMYDETRHTKAPADKGSARPTPPDGGNGGGNGGPGPDVDFASGEFNLGEERTGLRGITNAEQDASLTERGKNAPPKRRRGDAKVMQGAESLLSNAEFMNKLAHVISRQPRAIAAEENVAMAQRWLRLKDEYDDLVQSISEAENAGDADAVKEMKKRLAVVEKQMVETVKAREGGVGEAARTLRTNRILFDADYSYAGLVAKRQADLGRPLNDVEYKELKEIADALKKLDEKDRDLILARVKAFADKAIRDFLAQAKVDAASTPRTPNEMRKMMRKRNEALAQIEVLAYELGGNLDSIIPTGEEEDFSAGSQFVNMRRNLRALAEYHVYHNPDISEAELMKALMDDVSPWFTTDIHTMRTVFTGYGHSWKIDRSEIQRKVSDLTSQSRILEQILSLSNDELPKLTGPQRSDPSEQTRELQRIRDQMRRQKEREGVLPSSANHLKTALESAKTRYEHMIADIKAALDRGVQLPKRAPLGVTDAELEALKEEYARLRAEYNQIWGKRELTDEERRNIAIKGLQRTLEKWVDRLARAQGGDFTKPAARTPMSDAEIDALRRRIAETKDAWTQLKAAAHPNGTPDEIRELVARRLAAVNRAIRHWQEAMITGDIGPKAKKEIPFPDEKSRRDYEAAVEQRKRLYRQILDMREHDKNKKLPLGFGYAKEYASFVSNAMRSLLATADFSAMMRQTSALTTAHLPTAIRTLWRTFGALLPGGGAKARAIDEELKNNPLVREAIDNGWLEWRDLEGSGSSNDVEMFHGVDSQAITVGKRADGTERRVSLGDIPFAGSVLRGSERQYASFINMMSAEIYTKIVQSPMWGSKGPSDAQKREIAAYINMANGSAQLGPKGKQAMSTLTSIFWAPKLALSRLQLASGLGIIHPFVSGDKGDMTMRQRGRASAIIALEQARAFLGAAAAGWLLLALFGDDDDKYEMAQAEAMDKALVAMKPRIGSTNLDFSGGVTQWWKLLRMVYTGRKRTATGREIDLRNTYGRSLTQEIFRFAQGKLNPLASNALALIEGKDYVGNEFGLKQLVGNAAVPLAGQDIWRAATDENNGLARGLLMAPFILAGAGGSTYDVDRFATARNEFDARQKEYREAMKSGDYARIKELRTQFPELKQEGRLSALFEAARKTEAAIKKRRKQGLPDSPMLAETLQRQQEAALSAFRSLR